jgi:hypothetical protein
MQATHSKIPDPPKQPLRARVVALISHVRTLAFRVSRHRLLLRLLLLSSFAVLAVWVIFIRFISQQSYALPGNGDVSTSSPPLLLWRDFNPSSPTPSPSSLSSCDSSLPPLVGEWRGTCQQLLGLNVIDNPVCASAANPCSLPFAASYSAAGNAVIITPFSY